MSTRPIAPGLFETTPRLCLLGGRDLGTGRIVFPLPSDAQRFAVVALPDRGTLWSYTLQRFAPKTPPYQGAAAFVPFAVGYVELPGACIVESLLDAPRFDALRVGLPMQLTTWVLRRDAAGTDIVTYAFRPAAVGA